MTKSDDLPASEVGLPAEEVNDSIWNYPATYALIAANLAVFLALYRFGPMGGLTKAHDWRHYFTAGFDPDVLIRFGAGEAEKILEGQWYRLLTAMFLHVSVVHLMLNMLVLWNLGFVAEPLLGRRGIIAVYLLTGVAGNLASLTVSVVHRTDGTVAGASGAVFGLVGILIVLLSNRKLGIPWSELRTLRLLIVLFALVNLALGLVIAIPAVQTHLATWIHTAPENMPRVDNAAHIGGFLFGIALGIPLFSKMKSGKLIYRRRQGLTYVTASLLLCLFSYGLYAFAVGWIA